MQQGVVLTFNAAKGDGRARTVDENDGTAGLMHSGKQHLLNLGQFDGLLVATFALHTCRDSTDNDDSVCLFHLVGKIGEVGQLSLTDVATKHGELSVAATIFNLHIVSLSFLYVERLVVRTATSKTETTPAVACSSLLNNLAVHLQDVSVVGGEGILHFAGKRCGILSAHAYRKRVVVDSLGKAPGSECREVQLVVVAALRGFSAQFLVVPELHFHTLAVVEVLQMVNGGVLVVQFTSFMIDDVCVG